MVTMTRAQKVERLKMVLGRLGLGEENDVVRALVFGRVYELGEVYNMGEDDIRNLVVPQTSTDDDEPTVTTTAAQAGVIKRTTKLLTEPISRGYAGYLLQRHGHYLECCHGCRIQGLPFPPPSATIRSLPDATSRLPYGIYGAALWDEGPSC
jgi:hypothetical protein